MGKESCNFPALAFQCGQDDSALWKACCLDMLGAQMPCLSIQRAYLKDKFLPISYQVSMNGWEGSSVSTVHPISAAKEDAALAGYTRCLAAAEDITWGHEAPTSTGHEAENVHQQSSAATDLGWICTSNLELGDGISHNQACESSSPKSSSMLGIFY